MHDPCCSSHGVSLCCECYCDTHFVEVNRCRCVRQPSPPASLEGELERLEQEDPEVGAARASYDRMVDRVIGRGPATSYEDVRRIYEVGD